ncbi:DUF6925 family protein [Aliiroseovarius sp. PTFE2010]|uniref:DUF6925 family protein n=1 Tax=Aliiroseovarius sp. PTFE2010 TaxID=3417190 RepID=UPI003CE84F99
MLNLEDVLANGLQHPEAGWNMGSFGAIAEFHHVGDEVPPQHSEPLTQVTARGGVRIERLEGVRPVAYETLSPRAHRWSQAVSLCLPEGDAMMHRRDVLTELGPDDEALRDDDRGAILFDMGLAQPQVDFCIRTNDKDLLAILRENAGRSLMEHGNPAMPAILKAHPHRVALTKIGRLEVFQMIGGPDTGGVSPEGPHTHVLPKLLRAGRTHSANTPIPEGWVPCAGFHPENPVFDRMGQDKDFNRKAFDAFQTLLQAWGPDDYLAAKANCWAALEKGQEPDGVAEPASRTGRAGLRNGLRQWRRLHADSALLDRWSVAFDASTMPDEAEDENPGH